MSEASSSFPLVTVFVAGYNHARFVVEALESVRIQNYPAIQLIVADDCSKDNSVAVIRDWLARHWPDARLITHAENRGICRTFNEIISHATGKYISGFAADDVWLPGRLRALVEFMEGLPEDIGVVYGDAFQIDETGARLPETFNAAHRRLTTLPEGWIFDALAEGNFIPAMTTLVRRRCFETVGGYDESLAFEDWDMWLRISRCFQFRCWPEITASYRVLSTSMMRTQSAAIRESGERVLLKCLDRGWLKGHPRAVALGAERHHAMTGYRERAPQWFHAVWKCFRRHPSLKNLLLLIGCSIRLPAGWLTGIFGGVRKLKYAARA
jgi:glycosyltransferase involved in cell wall biosynthesis